MSKYLCNILQMYIEFSNLFFQTFIYLFAPICTNIRESDFANNFRLENGKQIWHALWEYRHPDAEGFIAPVSFPYITIHYFLR